MLAACMKGNLEAARQLIDQGADVNAKDKSEWTPLIWASSRVERGYEIVKMLLHKRADPAYRDIDGWTALTWAVAWNRPRIVELLVERGSDLNNELEDSLSVLTTSHLDRNEMMHTMRVLLKSFVGPHTELLDFFAPSSLETEIMEEKEDADEPPPKRMKKSRAASSSQSVARNDANKGQGSQQEVKLTLNDSVDRLLVVCGLNNEMSEHDINAVPLSTILKRNGFVIISHFSLDAINADHLAKVLKKIGMKWGHAMQIVAAAKRIFAS